MQTFVQRFIRIQQNKTPKFTIFTKWILAEIF